MLKVKIDRLNLTKNGTSKILLNNIDFELLPGNIYTIFGLNGSGKTTLLKSIIGNLDKRFYSLIGNIYLDDSDIYSMPEKELRHFRKNFIRFVFQDAITSFDPLKKLGYYFNGTVGKKQEVNNELKYFKMPEYDKLKNMYPFELSGGMAQRLSIILALISNAKLILMDEPTSALDVSVANLIKAKLRKSKKDSKAIYLIVTQDIKFGLETSDFVAFLKNGRLSDFEVPEKLADDNDLLNKFRD